MGVTAQLRGIVLIILISLLFEGTGVRKSRRRTRLLALYKIPDAVPSIGSFLALFSLPLFQLPVVF